MKKRSSLIIIVVLTLVLAIILSVTIAFLTLDSGMFHIGSKAKIANLNLFPSSDWHSTSASFTITNQYNSEVTVIGYSLNDVDYSYSDITVPPGQTKNDTVNLSGLVITASPSYNVELTITFEDGNFEVYAQNFTPIKYASSAMLDKIDFSKTNETSVSITFHNTGNIPLTGAKIKLGDYETILPLSNSLMAKESIVFENQPISGTFQNEVSYPVEYEWSFADGSIFTASNSVTFKENT